MSRPVYRELNICPAYGEIDTCPAYREIDSCPVYGGDRYMYSVWGGRYYRTRSFLNPVVSLTRRQTNLKCSNGNYGHGQRLQFQITTHYWMTRLFQNLPRGHGLY